MSDAPRARSTASGPDFLQRVVVRAFGQADAIAPRLPSLFEPLGPAVVWPAEIEHAEAQRPRADGIADRAAPVAERRDSSFPVPMSRQQGPAASDQDGEPDRRVLANNIGTDASAAVDERQPQRDAARVQPSARIIGRALRAESGAAVRASDGRLDVAARPERPSRSPMSELSGDRVPAHEMPTNVPTVRAQLVARALPENEDAPQANERVARMHDPLNALEPALRRIVVEAPAVRHRLEREPTGAAPAPSGAEPVVNVTIGRIEIRAVAAQSSPLRQPPRTPKPLSLNDYLKQRGRGR